MSNNILREIIQLSIITPCFNEEKSISLFYEKICKNIGDIDFELIFINDGSTDNTLEHVKKLPNIKYISFSRNFGK